MTQLQHPIREAERYLENAREILSTKAEKHGDLYQDKKYVKMAGDTAWKGVLVALDAVLHVSANKKKGRRLEYNDFQEAIAKKDKKMPARLNVAYDLLHKSMGYDGIQSYKVVQTSLEQAKYLITWCDKHYQQI
jgi:hypothetical protein